MLPALNMSLLSSQIHPLQHPEETLTTIRLKKRKKKKRRKKRCIQSTVFNIHRTITYGHNNSSTGKHLRVSTTTEVWRNNHKPLNLIRFLSQQVRLGSCLTTFQIPISYFPISMCQPISHEEILVLQPFCEPSTWTLGWKQDISIWWGNGKVVKSAIVKLMGSRWIPPVAILWMLEEGPEIARRADRVGVLPVHR